MNDSQLFEAEYSERSYQLPADSMPDTPSLHYSQLEQWARRTKRVGEGWLCIGDNEAAQARGWWIFFIVATLLASVAMVWLWVTVFFVIFRNGIDIPTLFGALSTIAVMWGLQAGLSWSKRRYDRLKIFEPARVMLINTVYGADASVPVIFQRNLKEGKRLPAPAEVFARLNCFELIERTVGTDTEYEQELLWRSEVVGAFASAGERHINADFELRTPVNPTPSSYRKRFSMKKYESNISWVIEIYQTVDKFKNHLIIPIEVQA